MAFGMAHGRPHLADHTSRIRVLSALATASDPRPYTPARSGQHQAGAASDTPCAPPSGER